MKVSPPARRRADVQGTPAVRRERVGMRYGHPAPLKHPCALEFHHNASAWRAGCPYRMPTLGAGSKRLFRNPKDYNKPNKNN